MKTYSDTLPETFVDLGGRYYFNYNITESEDKYSSETLEISCKSKPAIVQALIRSRYSYDDEIALINNYNAGIGIEEYNLYQDYRTWAKQIANDSIQ